MPAAADASVEREGGSLRFRGELVGAAVPALWRGLVAQPAGLRRIDIERVTRIDSAGLALLSAIADAAGGAGSVEIAGDPPGLAGLRAAYRLDPALGFGA